MDARRIIESTSLIDDVNREKWEHRASSQQKSLGDLHKTTGSTENITEMPEKESIVEEVAHIRTWKKNKSQKISQN